MIEYGQKTPFCGRSPSILFSAGQEAFVELGRLYERWNYTNSKSNDLGPTYFQLDKAINEANLAIEEEEGREETQSHQNNNYGKEMGSSNTS